MLEFAETLDELAASIAESLKGKAVPPDYAEAVARELAQEFATVEAPSVRLGTLGLTLGRYAIRQDDVKLFDALTDGFRAAAGVAFFAPHQSAPPFLRRKWQ